MTEFLVKHKGMWHIARPGAISNQGFDCFKCDGVAYEASNRTGHKVCSECEGTGKVLVPQIHLAWFNRDDAFICFAQKEDAVKELPDD